MVPLIGGTPICTSSQHSGSLPTNSQPGHSVQLQLNVFDGLDVPSPTSEAVHTCLRNLRIGGSARPRWGDSRN